MGRVEEQQGSPDPVPYPDADRPADSPEQDPTLAADGPGARSDQPSASEPAPDLKDQLPAQRRPARPAPQPARPAPQPARPAPQPAGPDSAVPPPSPRAGGSARDRLLC